MIFQLIEIFYYLFLIFTSVLFTKTLYLKIFIIIFLCLIIYLLRKYPKVLEYNVELILNKYKIHNNKRHISN